MIRTAIIGLLIGCGGSSPPAVGATDAAPAGDAPSCPNGESRAYGVCATQIYSPPQPYASLLSVSSHQIILFSPPDFVLLDADTGQTMTVPGNGADLVIGSDEAGVVYVADDNKRVYAMDLATGAQTLTDMPFSYHAMRIDKTTAYLEPVDLTTANHDVVLLAGCPIAGGSCTPLVQEPSGATTPQTAALLVDPNRGVWFESYQVSPQGDPGAWTINSGATKVYQSVPVGDYDCCPQQADTYSVWWTNKANVLTIATGPDPTLHSGATLPYPPSALVTPIGGWAQPDKALVAATDATSTCFDHVDRTSGALKSLGCVSFVIPYYLLYNDRYLVFADDEDRIFKVRYDALIPH